MRLKTLWLGAVVILMAPAFTMITYGQEDKETENKRPTVYNPYPPGILPSNLNSELERVLIMFAIHIMQSTVTPSQAVATGEQISVRTLVDGNCLPVYQSAIRKLRCTSHRRDPS